MSYRYTLRSITMDVGSPLELQQNERVVAVVYSEEHHDSFHACETISKMNLVVLVEEIVIVVSDMDLKTRGSVPEPVFRKIMELPDRSIDLRGFLDLPSKDRTVSDNPSDNPTEA